MAGEAHVAGAAPSREHWKVTPEVLSLKVKVALVELVGLVGPLRIVGAGGALSVTRRLRMIVAVARAPARIRAATIAAVLFLSVNRGPSIGVS